jgi:hypothetical protein
MAIFTCAAISSDEGFCEHAVSEVMHNIAAKPRAVIFKYVFMASFFY